MTVITPDILVGESARMLLCTADRPIFLTLRRLNGRVVICLTLAPLDETSKEIAGGDLRHGITPEEMGHVNDIYEMTEPYQA